MKGLPLPFEFRNKGVTATAAEVVVPCASKVVHFQDLVSSGSKRKYFEEPKSVLDNVSLSSPSPPTSTSTGGGGGGGGVVAPPPENQENVLNVAGAGGDEKCGEMEDWETVLSESGQEQSILRWIMGDVEDPSMGLNKLLHGGAPAADDAGAGFGVVDQGYLGFDKNGLCSVPPPATATAAAAVMFSDHHQLDVKPHLLINPNPGFYEQQQTLINPPNPKRYNSGSTQYNFPMHTLQFPPQDQLIIDQLFKASECIQSGNNPILAQSILARLNHQLSPIGKPFERAAFYFKEGLHLLLHSVVNNMNPIVSPFNLIFKIGAYKSFSEVSPLVQFTNFTCNQALLEVLDGFDRVHVVDFDLRFGDQWASFMQELALRSSNNNNRAPFLKITTFASPGNDHVQLGLTRENLVHFANELNIGFDFEIVSIDVLASVSWCLPFRGSDNEVLAVNLPISTVSNYQIPLPLVLRFVKNLAPKIVVSVDRGCERTDLPFSNHLIHALQSVSNLLESLDAVNMNPDSLQKIERFLIQPSVEKVITGRFSFPEKTQHWRSQFVSSGFSPLTFSNFTESQALCVIKRTPIRGFHVERRQSALVLCWQHRELVSASAWRC